MPDQLTDVLLGAALGLLALWLLLVAALAVASPGRGALTQAMRLLPDLLRLLPRLARDPGVPRRTRLLLWLTLGYLALPVDLVPDFVPVLGYADDAVVVCLVLRAVVRRAGWGTVARLWPGTPEGLDALTRLAGLRPQPPLDRSTGVEGRPADDAVPGA